jgi:hypothetical protein
MVGLWTLSVCCEEEKNISTSHCYIMGRKLEEPAELILQLCSELKISSVNIY